MRRARDYTSLDAHGAPVHLGEEAGHEMLPELSRRRSFQFMEEREGCADAVQLLAAERELTLERLARLTGEFQGVVAASRDTNADDEHDPEGATIAFERSQIAALVQGNRQHLDEIDAAVARVADGTYGTCLDCGQPIPPARLEARPVAARCINCA